MTNYTYAFYARLKQDQGGKTTIIVRLADVSEQADPMEFAMDHEEPGETFLNTWSFEA
ncbi:MAG TPA: hypothetical protein VF768_11720 [Holophagaceae bacterium]